MVHYGLYSIERAIMKISELEDKTGLTRDTVRYYERLGLISKPQRGTNGFRIYSVKNIKELNFIISMLSHLEYDYS